MDKLLMAYFVYNTIKQILVSGNKTSSGVMALEEEGAELSTLNFGLLENCRKIFVLLEDFCLKILVQKYKFVTENPLSLWNFCGKIKILIARNLLCSKFATAHRNSVRNVQLFALPTASTYNASDC